MEFSIREPAVDDALAIAGVHVRAWRDGYEGLMDQALLDSITVEQRAAFWTGILAAPNEGARFVAESDGDVVGFLIGTRASPDTDGAAEVFSIYVDPSAWRGGVGSVLLDSGVAALQVESLKPVILWVLEGNERACGFYESRGWRFDGGRKIESMGEHQLPHLRYRLDHG